MDREQLQQRFPSLRPIRSAPSLVTINGIGLTLYGARDHDAETGTYIKARCFALVFVPVLAIDAYRVAKAPEGWYFLGKEPLSTFTKMWNAAIALCVAAVIAIPMLNDHITSPEYLAHQQLEQAQHDLADGKLAPAITAFTQVAGGHTSSAAEAQRALGTILSERLPSASGADAVKGLSAIVHLPKASRRGIADDAVLITFAKTLIGRADDPRTGLKALDAITPLIKPEEKTALHEPLLVALVAKEPNEPQPASDLAEIYDGRDEADRCEALLTPHRAKLGSLEGARILGRIDAAKGRNEESYQLLYPYCKDRLANLQTLEKRYKAEEERAWKAAGEALNHGAAGDAWYRKHKGLDEARQGEMVDAWILDQVKRNAGYNQALEALRKAATIVPVALDLGVVTLQRAQTLTDKAARTKELEAAEKTFIAIKGLAGESDSYHLSYGQVCYWLGKHDAAQAEFDALLEKNKRSHLTLLGVAQIMREVGAMDKARALTEEAYKTSKSDAERYAAANLRALSLIDNDDSLLWLERADQHNPWVVCNLNFSRGRKFLESGENDKAAAALRACISGYEAMPKTAATLNNGALASHSLFQITGKIDDLDKGNRWLEEAIALQPGDSILMDNLASHLTEAGVMTVVGDRIDQVALRMVGHSDLLSYCYRDQAGKEALAAKLRADAAAQRAVKYYEKLLVLAPKSAEIYGMLRTYYVFTDDVAGMRTLQQRMIDAHLDPERERQAVEEMLSGKQDPRYRTTAQTRVRFLNGVLADPKLTHPSLTGSVATSELVEGLTTVAFFGGERDCDQLVRLAEQADSEAASVDTGAKRIHTLYVRALSRLEANQPTVAALHQEYRRRMSDNTLAILLCGDPAFHAALAADADIQQVATLVKQRLAALPNSPVTDDWALLAALEDPAAATCAEALKRDEIGKLSTAINLHLHVLRADYVITSWWRSRATGDQAGATAVLAAAREHKVMLPPQVQ